MIATNRRCPGRDGVLSFDHVFTLGNPIVATVGMGADRHHRFQGALVRPAGEQYRHGLRRPRRVRCQRAELRRGRDRPRLVEATLADGSRRPRAFGAALRAGSGTSCPRTSSAGSCCVPRSSRCSSPCRSGCGPAEPRSASSSSCARWPPARSAGAWLRRDSARRSRADTASRAIPAGQGLPGRNVLISRSESPQWRVVHPGRWWRMWAIPDSNR